MAQKIKHSYEFEGYRLNSKPLGLWRDGQLVSLPPKVLEMLILLVERKGEIVPTAELLDTVWPDTHVEEGNIKYTISLLRKALGKEMVQTIPRRGYRFVARVLKVSENGNGSVPGSEAAAAIPREPAALAEVRPIEKNEIEVSKNPRRVLFVALLAVVLGGTTVVLWRQFSHKPVPLTQRNIRSVAILPLRNLSDDETGKAFSLGLTDSLISRLGSLNRFIVRPLDAVEKYAKNGKDTLKAGEELKVDAVLEGTFQAAENRLRVNVRLIDVRDGTQIWTANFDETEGDVFKLQDKLTAQVANSLVIGITQQEQRLLAKKTTDNPEAYRAYARGRSILDQKNLDSFEKSVAEFQKALALDPAFALAYAGLAEAFLRKAKTLTGEEADVPITKAKLYAQKALELGEGSAEIYTVMGRIKRSRDWDWQGAERDFTRAIQLNPNYAEAHGNYALMLAFLGRDDEAMLEIKKALEINPISASITMSQFSILESRGEYAEALKRAEEFYRFDRENPLAKRAFATFLYHTGEHAKVIEIGEQVTPTDERQKFAVFSLLAAAYLKTNQPERAEETLRQLELLAQSDTQALYSLAMNYAELGRTDEAISALQKCFEMREERIVWLNVEPRFANLKTDSRFQDILQKMHLK